MINFNKNIENYMEIKQNELENKWWKVIITQTSYLHTKKTIAHISKIIKI